MAAGGRPHHAAPPRGRHQQLSLRGAATVLAGLMLLLLTRMWHHHGQLTSETAPVGAMVASDRKLLRGTNLADAADGGVGVTGGGSGSGGASGGGGGGGRDSQEGGSAAAVVPIMLAPTPAKGGSSSSSSSSSSSTSSPSPKPTTSPAAAAATPAAAPATAPSPAAAAATAAAPPAKRRLRPPLPPLGDDHTYTFYGVGGAYHHKPRCAPGWPMPGAGCDDPAVPCPVKWDWTTDPSAADAVVYNTLDGSGGYDTATRSHPGQKLVMFAMESGKYYPAMYDAKAKGFDISADYRLASDVPVTYYTRAELGDLRDPPVNFTSKRTDGLVAAFISNCGARNNRGEVLRDLIKLLPGQVHSYGACEHNKDIPPTGNSDRWKQKEEVLSTYKFAFTPENSIDEGYVTEKVYAALRVGTIPVYMGAPNIHRFIPMPDAVIQVKDFNTTADLAEYLKKVAADEKLYLKHTAWKYLPEAQWSEGWQELQRLQKYSAYCRMAMIMAGRPHKWRAEDVYEPA